MYLEGHHRRRHRYSKSYTLFKWIILAVGLLTFTLFNVTPIGLSADYQKVTVKNIVNVTDCSSDDPISGAHVTLFDPETGGTADSGYTNNSGTFIGYYVLYVYPGGSPADLALEIGVKVEKPGWKVGNMSKFSGELPFIGVFLNVNGYSKVQETLKLKAEYNWWTTLFGKEVADKMILEHLWFIKCSRVRPGGGKS